MPGLRSLVARRRCSLPSTHAVSSETVVCSYPSVPGTISSRKRNSLDEINQRENVIPNKEVNENDKTKWDLKTLFEIEDESVTSTKSELSLHREFFSCQPNKSTPLNGVNLSISEKENSSINHCSKSVYETSPKQERAQESFSPSNELGREFENDDNDLSKSKVSPERIVIKMKLLHGSSLSDVTNIASDTPEGSDSIKRSEINYEPGNTSKVKTRWTIDSILNQPVDSLKFENGHSPSDIAPESVENKRCVISSQELEKNWDSTDVKRESIYLNEVNLNGNCLDDLGSDHDVLSILPNHSHSLASAAVKNTTRENIETKQAVTYFKSKNILGFTDNIRRPSDSSDTSEDSVCSEASTVSSNSGASSDSSVKSCSIVIKRLENSDSYSCFRSPRNKRKRCQEIDLSRAVYMKNKNSSLPVLYIPKRLLYEATADTLPCSVTLCDIFSNYPFTKEMCPRCFNFYDLASDLFVNIYSSTITLQCVTCKWLVVRNLRSREVNLHIRAQNH